MYRYFVYELKVLQCKNANYNLYKIITCSEHVHVKTFVLKP